MAGTSGVIVELEAEPDPPAGVERRRALRVASALCLAVLSGLLGRDGVEGLAPTHQPDLLAAEVPPTPVSPVVISVPAGLEWRSALTTVPPTGVRAYVGSGVDPGSWGETTNFRVYSRDGTELLYVLDRDGTMLLYVGPQRYAIDVPRSWIPLTQPPPIRRSRGW